MSKFQPAISFIVLFLIVIMAGCSVPKVSPMLRVGPLDIDGDFKFNTPGPGLHGSASASDLGFDEETIVQPRTDLDWENWHLSVDGLIGDYDGHGTTTQTISLGGHTITQDTPVSSDLEFSLVTARVFYDILPIEFIDLGVGLGAGIIDYDFRIESRVGPQWISADDDLPFAFLTARLAKSIGPFEAVALVSGVGVEFDDEDLSYYDVDVFASYSLFGGDRLSGDLMLGYRAVGVDYEYKHDGGKVSADIDLDGPYLGFKLVF